LKIYKDVYEIEDQYHLSQSLPLRHDFVVPFNDALFSTEQNSILFYSVGSSKVRGLNYAVLIVSDCNPKGAGFDSWVILRFSLTQDKSTSKKKQTITRNPEMGDFRASICLAL
jgi:hypothetical protein